MKIYNDWKLVRWHWLGVQRENATPFGIRIDFQHQQKLTDDYFESREKYENEWGKFNPHDEMFFSMMEDEAREANKKAA